MNSCNRYICRIFCIAIAVLWLFTQPVLLIIAIRLLLNSDVQSWESSGSGRNATIAETYSVSRGTYRVVALIKAGTESKSPISAERTYKS